MSIITVQEWGLFESPYDMSIPCPTGEPLFYTPITGVEWCRQRETLQMWDTVMPQQLFVYPRASYPCPECPICTNDLVIDVLAVALCCGHMLCSHCYLEVDRCPVCRAANWLRLREDVRAACIMWDYVPNAVKEGRAAL